MKKILISTVAAAMVTTSLMATATGPGTSVIYAGTDVNGTVHSAAIANTTTTILATDSNMTTAAGALTADAAGLNFITYIPNIAIGQGNLITIKVNNGAILKNSANALFLVDLNSSLEQNATGGAPVVAKMINFVSKAGNYGQMTFKFAQQVQTNAKLALVNVFETNSTLQNDVALDYGLGSRTSALGIVVDQGLACADNMTLEVIESKDQSGDFTNVPNTAGKSTTGITVVKGVYVALNQDGFNGTALNTYTGNKDPGGDNLVSSATSCPTFSCQISIADSEKAFGSAATVNQTVCPTCTPSTTSTADLTCDGSFLLKYNSPANLRSGLPLTSIVLTTTDAAATMGELTKVTGTLNSNVTSLDLTIANDKKSATGSLTAGLLPALDNAVEVTYTADGTSVITPTTFDMNVKVNTNIDVDTITNFMAFTEQGTPLTVSYLNANPDYRTFVRVTSSKAATMQAVVTTEDGMSSARIDITKADGSAVSIGANGGAAVVEAADILRSAKDAGFAGAGNRFNATIYVKTTGTVDAVAYQTANGSQRYLPVFGAAGGGKI